MFSYFKNGSLPMMAASFALPLHTWKKQMMRTTKRIAMQTAPAIGTMNVKASTAETMSSRVLTMSSFNA